MSDPMSDPIRDPMNNSTEPADDSADDPSPTSPSDEPAQQAGATRWPEVSARPDNVEANGTMRLRPAQERILAYEGGYMGVSAVPGSGKTFILSMLAARLVARLTREGRGEQSEVLIVTLTNSAVENFRKRIARFLQNESYLLPGVGYTVRTLHGLAHDIVRERPGLVGLSEDFDIVDERTGNEIKRELVTRWLHTNPDAFVGFIAPDYLRRMVPGNPRFQDDMMDLANTFIGDAKNGRRTPQDLATIRKGIRGDFPLLDFGIDVYTGYQRALQERGAVDFNDLIVLALRALETDPRYLERLQDRWPYILEDEAQDSSTLQEEVLRLLSRKHGNWVRVGDPNQAINTTFTSASATHLQRFLAAYPEGARDLPNSGRSALPIIRAANYLIDWSITLFPEHSSELALQKPYIEPTGPGDPQPNPLPGTPDVYLHDKPLPPDKERAVVASSLRRWLAQNPDKTVAVLSPDNSFGFKFIDMLEAANIEFDDSLLRSDSNTRAGAHALSTVVNYLAQPQNTHLLSQVWSEVWWHLIGEPQMISENGAYSKGAQSTGTKENGIEGNSTAGNGTAGNGTEQDEFDENGIEENSTAEDTLNDNGIERDGTGGNGTRAVPRPRRKKPQLPEPIANVERELRRLREPELFIFPGENAGARGSESWVENQEWLADDPHLRRALQRFQDDLQRWSQATILPIGELVITLGNDLFRDPADLALAHRLAVLLDRLSIENPDYRLPELGGELSNIAQNKRRILGFTDATPEYLARPGVVSVGTMHAAKGLEWDRVYLTAINTFGFPSGGPEDQYRSERYYVRDRLNLSAEMKEQLALLMQGSLDPYVMGKATEEARYGLAAERLRLLYVGITRARQELIISYNTGQRHDVDPLPPANAFIALQEFAGG